MTDDRPFLLPLRTLAAAGALALGAPLAACAQPAQGQPGETASAVRAADAGAGDEAHGRRGPRGGRHGHGHRGHGPGHLVETMERELDLTPAQAAEVDRIVAAHRAEAETARAAGHARRRATRDALLAVLTPAQRAELDALREARAAAHLDRKVARMTEHLGLDAAQAERARGVLAEAQAERRALHEDASLAWEDRRARMEALRDETHAALDAILTPEQRAKAEAWRARRGHGAGGRHGRGHGHGPGGR